LSRIAYERLIELGVKTWTDKNSIVDELCIHIRHGDEEEVYGRYSANWDDGRTNPLLIQVIEELGSEVASGDHAEVAIVHRLDIRSMYYCITCCCLHQKMVQESVCR